jgi:hypothetical protein
VHYLAGKIQAVEEESLLKRLQAQLEAQFAKPDGLAKVFKEYAPEFTWLDKGNFEDPMATKVYEEWSASEESSYEEDIGSEEMEGW